MRKMFKMVALLAMAMASTNIYSQDSSQDKTGTPESEVSKTVEGDPKPETSTKENNGYSNGYVDYDRLNAYTFVDYRQYFESYRPSLAAKLQDYRKCHQWLMANSTESTSFEEFMCRLVYSRQITDYAWSPLYYQSAALKESKALSLSDGSEIANPVSLVEIYRQQQLAFNKQYNVDYSIEEYLCWSTVPNYSYQYQQDYYSTYYRSQIENNQLVDPRTPQ